MQRYITSSFSKNNNLFECIYNLNMSTVVLVTPMCKLGWIFKDVICRVNNCFGPLNISEKL